LNIKRRCKKESHIGTILAFSYGTSSNVLLIKINLIFVEKAFKEEYCTISVLHSTAVSKKLDSTGK